MHALAAETNLSAGEVETALTQLINLGEVLRLEGDRVIAAPSLAALEARALGALADYHERFPLRSGMPREEFRALLGGGLDGKAFKPLQSRWQERQIVQFDGATVRLPEFRLTLNERQQALAERIAEYYIACGAAIPTIEEVSRQVKAPADAIMALIRVGLERGDYLRWQDGVYYHTETVKHIKQIVAQYVAEHGTITAGAFRDLLETNRKFAVQALEMLDSLRFTLRQGDLRTLASTPADNQDRK
jgi:selenocysteine-specific elongation factor